MASSPTSEPLLYADTHTSADVLYFGRVVGVPDPFIAFGRRGRKYAVVSPLEFGRMKRESDFDGVLPLDPYLARAKKKWPRRPLTVAMIIRVLAREFGIRRFIVPATFPASVYQGLVELGMKVEIAKGTLFPQREIKSPEEAAAIREGNRCSALGLAAAERVLRASTIRRGALVWRGAPLTSERLKVAIETACLEGGSVSGDTIAAGGDQACDPHQRGYGPLRANELIIVDIFPRVAATGYYGDMTRTFLRGRASDAQRALVAAVREGQLAALRLIRAGVNGQDVHGAVVAVFKAKGYETRSDENGPTGFFHGTGHGVGLDVHEAPRVSAAVEYRLRKGSVVTVEPGLYYPGLGACRIEDMVQVTDRAPRLLSDFHYDWELR